MLEALRCAVVVTTVAFLGLLGLGGCVALQGVAQPPVPPEKLERLSSESCGVVSVLVPCARTTLDPGERALDFKFKAMAGSGILVAERTLLMTRHQVGESQGHILVGGQPMQYRVERTMGEPTYATGWALLTGSSDPAGWVLATLSSAPKGIHPIDVDAQTALPDGATIFLVYSELVNREDVKRAFKENCFDMLTFRQEVAVGRVVRRKPKWLRRWIETNPQEGRVLSELLLVLGTPELVPGTSGAAAFWWPDGSENPTCVGILEVGVEFHDHRADKLLGFGGLIRRPPGMLSDGK